MRVNRSNPPTPEAAGSAPTGLRTAAAVLRLDEALRGGAGKRDYLALVDELTPRVAADFAAAYGSEAAGGLLALKVMNLAVARFHFLNRHTSLVSRPIQLMVDPANACQLHCPGCLHTSRPSVAREAAVHWPPVTLSAARYEALLEHFGPWAFGAVLYNYGEPLLNRRTSDFITRARRDLLFTLLSTNFSIPKLDAEALVASGLNHLIVSIDGVTQETYARYRRGGRLDLVLSNLQRVVDAKRRLGLCTPYVVWQFLTFEHNVHEADAAFAQARDMGVDAFHFLTPFDVSWDDPACRAVRSLREGYHHFTPVAHRLESLGAAARGRVEAATVEPLLRERWTDRMERLGVEEEPARPQGQRCGWLYKSISMDGAGRLMPCCDAPSAARHLAFGGIDEGGASAWNLEGFRLARLALADRESYLRRPVGGLAPHCPNCTAVDTAVAEPPHNLWRVRQDMPTLDPAGVLSGDALDWLLGWG